LADADSEGPDQLNGADSAKRLVGEQFGKVWDELAAHRLKVQPGVAAKLMAQTLMSLDKMDGGAPKIFLSCVLWTSNKECTPRPIPSGLGCPCRRYEEAT
jgi:hypothetical protein